MQLETLQKTISSQVLAHPIVGAIQAKTMNILQYRTYMEDVYAYAQHSSQVIALSAVRLIDRQPELARYLLHHADEELGHDKWAASDLRDLGMTEAQLAASRPSPACLRMIGLEYYFAQHANPVGLLGWMFVLESLGGHIGGQIARGIDAALELQGKGTYFLAGHGEADAHHSEDLFRVINANVTEAADREAFACMAREGRELYCQILDHAYAAAPLRH
jgi:heme oxygenase